MVTYKEAISKVKGQRTAARQALARLKPTTRERVEMRKAVKAGARQRAQILKQRKRRDQLPRQSRRPHPVVGQRR